MGLSLEQVRQRGGVWCGGFAAEAQEPAVYHGIGSVSGAGKAARS